MRRQQADAPNHCSSSNKSIYVLLCIAAAASPPLADAPLLYAVCHTACSSSAFVTAAPVSFMPLRSLQPALRSISPRALPCQSSRPGNRFADLLSFLKQLYFFQKIIAFPITPFHPCTATRLHCPIAALASPSRNILANGHWVPFRSTTASIHFSSIQSTRCQ
jgi:hypothetical protein